MPLETLTLILIGVGTGTISGALGLGGGFLLVPVFHTVFDWPLIQSVAASQFCILATSISSTHRYSGKGLVDHRLGVLLGSTTIIGAAVGASLAANIPEEVLVGMFVVITLYAGTRMWRSTSSADLHTSGAGEKSRLRIGMGLSGLVGFLTAVLGLGGGILQVPIMHTYLRVPIRNATATSAFIIGLNATTSAAIYYHRGDLRVEDAAAVALGILLGAFLGAAGQHRVPAAVLRRTFSFLLLILAARMIMRAFGW